MAQPLHLTPIGTRREKVVIEERVESTSGFPVDTWEPLMTMWMEKVDLIGAESFRADQMTARYDCRFKAKYAHALDPEIIDVPARHRLKHRGQVYDITSAAIVGHFEGIEYFAIASTETEA